MSDVKTWVVRVYDENEKLVARWHIEDRTEREAEREAMADINREHPGCGWTLTPSAIRTLRRGNRMEAKEVVAVMLEAEPDPAHYLAGVKPFHHYYDIHVSEGDDQGFSVFVETRIPPPAGIQFAQDVPDPVRQQVIDFAVAEKKLDPSDVAAVDYVALMDAEEYNEFYRLGEAQDTDPVDRDDPQYYIDRLPSAFDAEEVMDRIQNECAYCMDSRADKQEFLKWIKDNEDLFPDVAKALEVIQRNDSWCTDSEDDMWAFFEQLGHRLTNDTCPRCDGTGEEPGAPVEMDGRVALCNRCAGSGRILTHCECDNTHQANDTVCRWCWARGRRHFNDPPV